MHPYEMASTLRERGKEYSININFGSLYSVIGSLERQAYIAVRERVRDSARPDRTIYIITPEGADELHDWLRDLLRNPVKEFPQFEAALSLMPVLPPEEVAALLEQRTAQVRKGMNDVRKGLEDARRQGLEELFLIESEYSLAVTGAELAFTENLVRLIRESPDFTKTWLGWHRERAASSGTRGHKNTKTR